MHIVHKKHRDVQRAYPVAECALCGAELYGGDACWRLSGRVLCEACVLRLLLDELAPYRLVLEVRP